MFILRQNFHIETFDFKVAASKIPPQKQKLANFGEKIVTHFENSECKILRKTKEKSTSGAMVQFLQLVQLVQRGLMVQLVQMAQLVQRGLLVQLVQRGCCRLETTEL
ncbi:hypothetical protein Tcan_18690 [Toxocara canis]|uniref:Uncharacterized protein n=2 Tax=Toxocara canis TaxID=6265 RepID=A0A0B2USN9_TOXCA|nr:hypothetical protein Tcan_18690 [Toxocara canis]VDM39133.1 unnamed protein product [Toxocara canis]